MKWFAKTLQTEDMESLLPPSPSSALSNITEATFIPTSSWKRIPRLTWHLFHQILIFCIPSFLRRVPRTNTTRTTEKSQQSNHPKKHATEYLDGVRGLASFIVFVFHWTHYQYPGTNTGYGARKNSSIWQLPIIRLVYSGAAMVSIFFVVSGYVLTHRFVQKMYRHEFESLFSGLTSLTFRRAPRLFLPSAVSAFLAFACVSFGFVAVPSDSDFQHGLFEMVQYIDRETDPWTWDAYMTGFYNPQLWSIAVEYRGSLVVFLIVLGLARCRPQIRMAVESALIAHAFGHKRWDVALFVAGLLVAEVDVMVSTSTSCKAFMRKKHVKVFLVLMMLVGAWLAGFPRDRAFDSWGYGVFQPLWPFSEYRRRFWLSLGSIFIVAPMPFLPGVQAFFNTKLIRYLGKVSFALYLIQGLANRTIGILIIDLVQSLTNNQDCWSYALSYFVTLVLYTPILIWWSDVYWRAFDLPSNNFAKWLESKCLSKPLT